MALNKLHQIGVQKNELGEIVAYFELKTINEEKANTIKRQALENRAKEIAKQSALENEIKELKCELDKIRAELAFNRGDITAEEYEELCGLKN